MKNNLILVLAVSLSLILLNNCSEDDQPNEPVFQYESTMIDAGYSKLWKISKMIVNGNEVGFINRLMFFDKYGNGIMVFDENENYPDTALVIDKFRYEVLKNGTQLKFTDFPGSTDGSGTVIYSIKSISDSIIEVIAPDLDKTKIIYVPFVSEDKNASEKNRILTNGNVKIWRSSAIYDDDIEIKSPCRDDDLYLFATNGTGIVIFGEKICNNNKNQENDFFKWKFSDNNTKIIMTELQSSWDFDGGNYIPSGEVEIKSLTEGSFIQEETSTYNGKQVTTRMEFQPLVK